LEGYCIALAKPRRKVIPTSFCDNIVNHETIFKKIKLFHVHYITPNIFIQVNEGIAMYFTLMVKCFI
jgi:hypothetical protein